MDFIKVTNNQFQLNTANTSYVMHNEDGFLCHTYYGKRLPDCDHSYMAKRPWFTCDFNSDITENLPSLNSALLEYPAFGDGGINTPAIDYHLT